MPMNKLTSAWPFLFNIPFLIDGKTNNRVWDFENRPLKFILVDFAELTARRNLIIHRGLTFDEQYIDDITHLNRRGYKVKKRIREERTKEFFTLGLFKTDRKILKKIEELNKNEVPISIDRQYFVHAFTKLYFLYFKFWSSAANEFKKQPKNKKKDLNDPASTIGSALHELLILGRSSSGQSINQLLIDTSMEYNRTFVKDGDKININNVDKIMLVNTLLALKEKRRINRKKLSSFQKYLKKEKASKIDSLDLKKIKAKISKKDSFELLAIEHLSKEDDPNFKLFFNIYNGNKTEAIKQLKECKLKDTGADDWFMFIDLKKDKAFKKQLDLALKR